MWPKLTGKSGEDETFQAELDYYLKHYVGRPSPLYYAERLSRELGGAQIYLKREDLNHTGAHKINNVLGQALLAKRMGVRASLRRLALDSTELPPQQPVPSWIWTVQCTWAGKTWPGRN